MAKSLSEFFAEQSRRYGTWVACTEVRSRMKFNLLPPDHDCFVRAVDNSLRAIAQWKAYQAASAWGVELSKLIGAACQVTDDDSYPSSVLAQHVERGRRIVSTGALHCVRNKLTKMTNADGDSLMCTCNSCAEMTFPSLAVRSPDGAEMYCPACVSTGAVRESRAMEGWLGRYSALPYYGCQDDIDMARPDVVTQSFVRANSLQRHGGYYYAEGLYNVYDELGQTLFGYHDGPQLPKIPGEYGKRKIPLLLGMELEIETGESSRDDDDDDGERTGGDREWSALSVVRTLNKITQGYCKAENDGSLDSGFEVITAPAGLDIHAKTLAHLKDAPGIDDMSSHTTTTCGLHVHACRLGMTPLHAAKLMKFVNMPENERLMRTIARRYNRNSGYAKFYQDTDWMQRMAKTAGHDAQIQKRHGRKVDVAAMSNAYTRDSFVNERYSAINFNPEYTVEFRMFRGTLRYESIMACLEFTFAAWHFAKQSSMNDLTTEAFMKFICADTNRNDTKFLRHYLKAKDFRAFHQAEVVVRPKLKLGIPSAHREAAQLDRDPITIMSTAQLRHRGMHALSVAA